MKEINKMLPELRNGSLTWEMFGKVMTERDFFRLSRIVHSTCGIRLLPVKKTMLEGRLRKRLKALGIDSFDDYCSYLMSEDGMQTECVHMVDVVTTNKTDFFREPGHFDYLSRVALPDLARSIAPGRGALRVWSAGCSSGEEPYTLAMVLSEYARAHPGLEFTVFGTDISTEILEKARSATYNHERVEPLETELRKRYLLKSRDRTRNLVRIAPEIRSTVTFRRLNFMDSDYMMNSLMHVVFCRNVLIYFDRETQEQVIGKICRYLAPGGYLFIGHSETLQNMNVPLIPAATTVYKRVP